MPFLRGGTCVIRRGEESKIEGEGKVENGQYGYMVIDGNNR